MPTDVVNLTFDDLSRLVCPFLRLDGSAAILRALRSCLKIPIESLNDAVCQNKRLIMFKGFRLDIRGIQVFDGDKLSLNLHFKAKKKWWHSLFGSQTAEVVADLQRICQTEILGLQFERYRKSFDDLFELEKGPVEFVYLHDSRALNSASKFGYDVSPLLIAPDNHHGKCFVEFQLNPLAYDRVGSSTILRTDWREFATAISDGIEAEVDRRLGRR